MKTALTTTPLLYKNDKDLPIFECGKKEQYTAREAAEILLCEFEKGAKCNNTPESKKKLVILTRCREIQMLARHEK